MVVVAVAGGVVELMVEVVVGVGVVEGGRLERGRLVGLVEPLGEEAAARLELGAEAVALLLVKDAADHVVELVVRLGGQGGGHRAGYGRLLFAAVPALRLGFHVAELVFHADLKQKNIVKTKIPSYSYR